MSGDYRDKPCLQNIPVNSSARIEKFYISEKSLTIWPAVEITVSIRGVVFSSDPTGVIEIPHEYAEDFAIIIARRSQRTHVKLGENAYTFRSRGD